MTHHELRKMTNTIAVFATEYIRHCTDMGVEERQELQNEIVKKIDSLLSTHTQSLIEKIEGLKKQYQDAYKKRRIYPEDVSAIEVLDEVLQLITERKQ